MELSGDQVAILIGIAIVLTQVFKVIALWTRVEQLDGRIISAALFVISLVLSVLWLKPTLPSVGAEFSIIDFTGSLLALAGTVFGFAKLIYEFLFVKIFDKLGLNTKPLVERNIIKARLNAVNPPS